MQNIWPKFHEIPFNGFEIMVGTHIIW
jgi:hypothetical protein